MSCLDMKVTLLSGNVMPYVGLGTFRITGRQLIFDVVNAALSCGIRCIDTASAYNNEDHIGEALKDLLPKYKLKREDVFIITKLSPSDHAETAEYAIHRSLTNLQLTYIDLFLIHWPGAAGVAADSPSNSILRNKSWETLMDAQQKGILKSIGVSNYTEQHLNELITKFGVKPDVNQVEFHPHYYQKDLLDYCRNKGIFLQAYSSLGGVNAVTLLKDPIVTYIAKQLNKTSAQILLRWALQHEVGIIPKASSKAHIQQNVDLNFVIPDELMANLDFISRSITKKNAWDPSVVR